MNLIFQYLPYFEPQQKCHFWCPPSLWGQVTEVGFEPRTQKVSLAMLTVRVTTDDRRLRLQ